MHKVFISNEDRYENKSIDKSRIIAKFRYFGLDYHYYSSFSHKLSYVVTYASRDKDLLIKINNMVKDYFNLDEDLIFKYTFGDIETDINKVVEADELKIGGIDEYSFDEISKIFETDENLYNFLFNKLSNIITNDDYD